MSLNVERYEHGCDNLGKIKKKKRMEYNKNKITDIILNESPDICCIQEHVRDNFIVEYLNNEYCKIKNFVSLIWIFRNSVPHLFLKIQTNNTKFLTLWYLFFNAKTYDPLELENIILVKKKSNIFDVNNTVYFQPEILTRIKINRERFQQKNVFWLLVLKV